MLPPLLPSHLDLFSPIYCWTASNSVFVQPRRRVPAPPLPSIPPPILHSGLSLNTLFQPSPPGDIQVLARLSAVLSESETLSKSQFCSGSSLRGHLEWAPWKPNKGAGQLLSVLELRGAVGSVWSAGGYLGNTSVEFLNLGALLFRSNYILMLLLSWKLEQSLTSTWSIMYKLVAVGKILHILSITVGCWWAHVAGPGLIITLPEGLWLRQEAPYNCTYVGAPSRGEDRYSKNKLQGHLWCFRWCFFFFFQTFNLIWMCQRGWSFCHTSSTTPVLRLWSVWSDLFACGLTFS